MAELEYTSAGDLTSSGDVTLRGEEVLGNISWDCVFCILPVGIVFFYFNTFFTVS